MRFPRFSRISKLFSYHEKYEVGDQVQHLYAKSNKQRYELYLSIPNSYDGSKDKHYPILYLLDGRFNFSLVESIYYNLLWDEVIDEMFIVGISYGYDVSLNLKKRQEDLVPLACGGSVPGSEAFSECLNTDIIPFIENQFPVDSNERIIAGGSLGAHFALSSVFTMTNTFSAHIAMSPPITQGSHYLPSLETAFGNANKELKKCIWYCVGSEEEEDYINEARDFEFSLISRQYEGLFLKFQIIEGEKHAGVKAEGFSRSLRAVFEYFRKTRNLLT